MNIKNLACVFILTVSFMAAKNIAAQGLDAQFNKINALINENYVSLDAPCSSPIEKYKLGREDNELVMTSKLCDGTAIISKAPIDGFENQWKAMNGRREGTYMPAVRCSSSKPMCWTVTSPNGSKFNAPFLPILLSNQEMAEKIAQEMSNLIETLKVSDKK